MLTAIFGFLKTIATKVVSFILDFIRDTAIETVISGFFN